MNIDEEENNRDEETSDKRYGKHTENVRFLIDVYFLADRLLDPVIANLVIDELNHFLDNQDDICTAAIIHIYASTKDGSPLRIVLRDIYIHENDGS